MDDGSTDGSSKICDEYADIDSRIIVIHQKNCGVGYARKIGVQVSKGQYIGFVDADDYIDIYMYEKMLQSIVNNQTDLAICDYYGVYNNKIHATYQRKQSIIMDKCEALIFLASDDIKSFMGNKLYKANVLKKEDFNYIKYFEDYLCMPDIFNRCDKISYLHEALYYYVRHDDSRTGIDDGDYLFFLATLARKRWFKKYYRYLDDICFSRVIKMGLTILENNNLNNSLSRKIKKYFSASLCKIVKINILVYIKK